ncbi:MAG: sigma 54-interacting transcriptional regulator [Planctomycetota bacterium]
MIEALERQAEHRGQVARSAARSSISSGGTLVGASPAMHRLQDEIRLVAKSDFTVLIEGETGAGKELVARQIHELGAPRRAVLLQVNCALLESIAESELFGHVAGAFTGATRDRTGVRARRPGHAVPRRGGRAAAHPAVPSRCARCSRARSSELAPHRVHHVDVRIIAATNRNLEQEVEAGRFRADLYHRLAVYPLRVAPLRERRADIPLLAAHFLDACRRRLGLGVVRLTEEAREQLSAQEWPGNVRELENVLSRGVLRAARAYNDIAGPILVKPEHLDLGASAPRAEPIAAERELATTPALPLAARVDAFRRREILRTVERHGGNWAAAARELGMHRANLHHLVRRLGIGGAAERR